MEGGRGAARGGAVLGATYFGLVFHWIPVALVAADATVRGVALALAAFGVIVVGLAGLTALFVVLLHHAVRHASAPLALALPVTWTALEWTRAHLPDSLALPWLGLGTSLTAVPEIVGVAELVGARGVTFWLAAVNGLLASLWVAWRRSGTRAAAPLAATTLAVTILPGAWGVWRAHTLETRHAADVVVVQPNVEGRTKIGDRRGSLLPAELPSPRVTADDGVDVRTAADPLASENAFDDDAAPDLVVLPELVLRGDPRSPEATDALATLTAYARDADAPVLFGALGGATGAEAGETPYNSAFLLEPSGLADFRYDKRRLVPVVERVPFLPASVLPRSGTPTPRRRGLGVGAPIGALGAYRAGEGAPLARLGDLRVGVLICYESSYPEETRALRRAGADVVVNITNDVWLGGPPGWARTVALWQHPAHLVMRAIEGRVGVVRAANTGISMVVDPVGRTYAETDLFAPAVRAAGVRTSDVATMYTRFGDVLGGASALVAFGLLLLAWTARRERRRGSSPSLDRSGSRV